MKIIEIIRSEQVYIKGAKTNVLFEQDFNKIANQIENVKVGITKLKTIQDDLVGEIDIVECCEIGPIIKENYCPNCGKKITK